MANSSWWKYTFWKSVRPSPAPMHAVTLYHCCAALCLPGVVLQASEQAKIPPLVLLALWSHALSHVDDFNDRQFRPLS